MPQVANCPQCNHDLLVPDATDDEAWAKCPECRAFFQLSQAELRELPVLLLVEPDSTDAVAEAPDAPTEAIAPAAASAAAGNDVDVIVEELPKHVEGAGDTQSTAERIDEWFRSTKPGSDAQPDDTSRTLAEVPGDFEADSDFQLDTSPEDSQSTGPWDDSPQMEQLLADIETPPVDSASDDETTTTRESNAENKETIAASSAAELPVFSKTNGKPRRKRSLVRTLMLTTVAGIVGLALGYYALLWLRGPTGDFLDIAQYLPNAMLPAELQSKSRPAPAAAPPIAQRESEEPESAPVEVSQSPAAESAEVQASFTTADERAPADSQPLDDRYGLEAAETPSADEPAPLDEPAAIPLADAGARGAPAEAAQVDNAPSFTADELTAAVETAKQAQPALMTGSLQDGRDVQRAKGYSYSILADLAQKASFVDASSNSDAVATAQQEAEVLFQKTLSDAPTRREVAEILPKWIASPHRKHGGVFFVASLSDPEEAGSVSEFRGAPDTGQSLTLLVSKDSADHLDGSSRPMGIVGWIVEQPSEHVTGYTGSAPQAIWVSHFIPLEDSVP